MGSRNERNVLVPTGKSYSIGATTMQMKFRVEGTDLFIVLGDLTDQETDAIVNAANSSLMGGGGVDGAIHRRGGPTVKEECSAIIREKWPHGLPPGEAVLTGAGKLAAKFIIHTVGPVWRGGDAGEPAILARCYASSLELADLTKLKSVSFPSISTGAYGYPIHEAGRIALNTVVQYLHNHTTGLTEIRFVLYSSPDYSQYIGISKEILA